MKQKKRILGAAVLTFLTAVGLFLVMISMEKKALSEFEKKEVWISKKSVMEGDMINANSIESYFELVQVDSRAIPEDAIYAVDSEQKMKLEIAPGTILTKSLLEDIRGYEKQMKEPVLVGIRVEDLYQVVGGVLRPGDQIHLFVIDENTGSLTQKWENLTIVDCFDSSGNRIEESENGKNAIRFNVCLERCDVEAFYEGLSTKNMWAALVC